VTQSVKAATAAGASNSEYYEYPGPTPRDKDVAGGFKRRPANSSKPTVATDAATLLDKFYYYDPDDADLKAPLPQQPPAGTEEATASSDKKRGRASSYMAKYTYTSAEDDFGDGVYYDDAAYYGLEAMQNKLGIHARIDYMHKRYSSYDEEEKADYPVEVYDYKTGNTTFVQAGALDVVGEDPAPAGEEASAHEAPYDVFCNGQLVASSTVVWEPAAGMLQVVFPQPTDNLLRGSIIRWQPAGRSGD
jgi:hypothetical protein